MITWPFFIDAFRVMSAKDSNKTYYVVRVGREPGIYNTWSECKKHVVAYKGAKFRKFSSLTEAKAYFEQGTTKQSENVDDIDREFFKTCQNYVTLLQRDVKEIIDEARETDIKHQVTKINVRPPTTFNRNTSTMENTTTTKEQSSLPKREHVWVRGGSHDVCNTGVIGVYFSTDDERNHVGVNQWPGCFNQTRCGLAACVKALSIYGKNKKTEDCEITLVIHTVTRYLYNMLVTWLKNYNKPWDERKETFKLEKDKDIFNFMRKQLRGSNIKLLIVLDTIKNGAHLWLETQMSKFNPTTHSFV